MAEHLAEPATQNTRFRFTTRDLLLFTAAVAIYILALQHLMRWAVTGSAGPSGITVQFALMIFVAGTLAVVVWNADRRAKMKLGVNQIRWRRAWSWRTAVRLAFLCLLAALFIAQFPTTISVFAGLLLACATFALIPIRIGANGISYQAGIFVPWSRYDVNFDEVTSTLTLKLSKSEWKHHLAIPVQHREQVEQILRQNSKLPPIETQLAPGESPGAKWG